jgi:hypothetical protein
MEFMSEETSFGTDAADPEVLAAEEETALDHRPEGTVVALGPFCLTATGMIAIKDATFDEWSSALQWTQRVNDAVQFWVGDLLEYGEAKWGEKYSQALDTTELHIQTLRNAAWVARQIPPNRRRAALSFSHHEAVAPLDPEQQEYWLKRSEHDNLTRDQLRIAIRQAKAASEGKAGEFWLYIKCTDEIDQAKLAERCRSEGREVKIRN